MRNLTWLTFLAVSLSLAACGSGEEATDMENRPMTESMPMADDKSMMSSGAEMRMANSEGTVTAVDDEVGTITIDHDPVPAVDWPAMTMTFQADEAHRRQVAVGDEVEFAFRMTNAGSEITSITQK
ncbi:MAG: copper-binding protein [Parasphingorhabdus sp.]